MFTKIYMFLRDKLSGGEAWTHITRRAAQERPLEVIVVAFFLGALCSSFLTWRQEILAYSFALAGIIVGHIFWGSKHIR